MDLCSPDHTSQQTTPLGGNRPTDSALRGCIKHERSHPPGAQAIRSPVESVSVGWLIRVMDQRHTAVQRLARLQTADSEARSRRFVPQATRFRPLFLPIGGLHSGAIKFLDGTSSDVQQRRKSRRDRPRPERMTFSRRTTNQDSAVSAEAVPFFGHGRDQLLGRHFSKPC